MKVAWHHGTTMAPPLHHHLRLHSALQEKKRERRWWRLTPTLSEWGRAFEMNEHQSVGFGLSENCCYQNENINIGPIS
jgi:hypothetical protein